MDTTIAQTGDRLAGANAGQATQNSADVQRRPPATAGETAEATETRRILQGAETTRIVESTFGVNTRLSISRNDNFDAFVYRVIDRVSGEILREWPPVQFARFLEENGAPGLTPQALTGLAVDERA